MGNRGAVVVDHPHSRRAIGRLRGILRARGISASRGWRAVRFAGPLPLDQTGILASVTGPLAAAHISVFALGTYDTDYVLIPEAQRTAAIDALERAGHSVGSAGY